MRDFLAEHRVRTLLKLVVVVMICSLNVRLRNNKNNSGVIMGGDQVRIQKS